MVNLTIDGRQIAAEEGVSILHAARENNIYIPSLCDNEAVAPYGACRLCLVEIKTASGRERLVTSCIYQVEEGLAVRTNTERVIRNRRMLLEMLLARCPESEVVRDMAREYGVTDERLTRHEGNNNCILCALCARTCEEVVGVCAVSLSKRGVERKLTTPFDEDYSEACIGCGSCAYVCPTNAITMEDRNGTRTIRWPHNQMEFKLKQCSVCQDYWVPEKQIEYIAKISGTPVSDYDVCPNCRT